MALYILTIAYPVLHKTMQATGLDKAHLNCLRYCFYCDLLFMKSYMD